MAKNLVIVESPAKAKTIEGFLGKDFIVKSSYGHVRDLPKKGAAIDIEKNFEPTYEVSPDKKEVIAELRKLTKKADTIWLATDEDREGEAISWHLFETLKLNNKNTKRIVFHEITKRAILEAIENPRSIDKNLVDAQQARRILDRLVGFELSPVLWKKVKPSLSAGRVQSVAVRLIVEREREIDGFKSQSAFKVVALFDIKKKGNTYTLKAELPGKINKAEEAEDFLNKCRGAGFKIINLEKKPSKRSPAAPFTTSTLQQEASRKLGFSVARTMTVAQKLYESGKITYMRTDSVNLSRTAMGEAKAEIEKSFGKKYAYSRQYTTKTKGAQEAHEAIRPTYMNKSSISGDSSEQRLYELIWKRTIASQMADAQIEKTIATIAITGLKERLIAQGEVIKFDGFLKVYLESTDEESEESTEGMLPPIEVGEALDLKSLTATEKFTHHPPRYTEASLVKKLEELGIGRPSTYAPTISTVQKRGYVVKEEREGKERKYRQMILKNGTVSNEVKKEMTGAEKGKLFPTDIGIVVNDFLVENFKNILDYNFTAQVEKEFDEIAQGDKVWNEMIRSFYTPFHENVEHTEKVSERAKGERELGIDARSGKPIIAKIGRYGPLIQIGTVDDEEKPLFARLRPTQRIETITLEEAMELFKLPRTVGSYEDEEVKANVGRFGPYILHKKAFYSIPKGEDPLDISLERAVEIIEAKRKAEREKLIKTFPGRDDIQVLKGRYGPYISFGEKNLRIPKGIEPSTLTLDQILDIEKKQEPSKSRSKSKRKTIRKKN
jgi:DNA topoisomerase I